MRKAQWRFLFACLPVLAGQVHAAVSVSPMAYLSTHGPAADPVTRLNWGLIAISLLVILIISVLVLHACLRKRPPLATGPAKDVPGRMPVGPEKGGMSWVYIGVGISIVVLFGTTLWTLSVLSAVASPSKPALTVEIMAHEWWWEVRYHGNPMTKDATQVVITANEIHIPVGEPVHFELKSDNVIHSFWVPKLGGKTDVIPGQTNYNWVQADQPGEYRGQCAEFCGPQHAHMAFYVIAEPREQFEAWWQQQSRDSTLSDLPTNTPDSPDLQQILQGRNVFMEQCSHCHAVKGTRADGRLGPDLTHLMSRRTIAAGMLPNTTASLHGWVADAQQIKPGSRMPSLYLSPQDLHAVVDYLKTLQ